ncbi:hypothetical protein AA309_27980 [Microvirga vignae]|uniref:Uncharacterized protein n=1 Tax=Microvirga vignae TaxID=1225564 RepID=A0A0H1RBT0_9HYPH|nr:hypothetical protein AA309_27980 [Microvirga vignae]
MAAFTDDDVFEADNSGEDVVAVNEAVASLDDFSRREAVGFVLPKSACRFRKSRAALEITQQIT